MCVLCVGGCQVLHEYVDSMEFTGLEFDEAIRYYLSGSMTAVAC